MAAQHFLRILGVLALSMSAALTGLIRPAFADTPRHGDGPHPLERAAAADASYVVRVVIEEILATNNFDGDPFFDKADFFAVVRIGDSVQTTAAVSNNQNPKPNWELSRNVTVPSASSDSISIAIDIRDSDDCGTTPTCGNQADITADANRELNLIVNLSQCATVGVTGAITGALTGNCGQTIITAGTTGPGTENTAELKFRIVVDPPPSAPGVNVRAWHETLWPQGGETLTFTAESLDDSEALLEKPVTRIEIWIDNSLVQTCTGESRCATTRIAPPAGGSIAYRADVIDGDTVISTGWRRVQVGQPPEGRAVPVVFTGPRASRVDIALVPATGSYTSALDPAFHVDALNGLRAYFSRRWLLKNQDKFNFWIAQDFGTANGFGSGMSCVVAPSNWGSTYAFVESGAILHSNLLRDCARPSERIFTAEPFDQNVMLHEAGHAAFGLADEYCCDSSYSVPDPLPNIYGSLAACQSDVLQLQPFDARIGVPLRTSASCRQIASGPSTIPFFKSDPEDDLMNGNGRIQGADLRRMEWIFNELCASAACGGAAALRGADFERTLAAFAPPAFDYGSRSKLIRVSALASNPAGLTMTGASAPSVLFGRQATSFQSPSAVRVQAVNMSGTVLSEYRMWNPLLNKSWLIAGSVEFPVKAHGPDQLVPNRQMDLTVPFSAGLRRMRVLGPAGGVLLDVDMLPAMQAYCAANRTDLDCAAVPPAPTAKLFLPLMQR